jgi:hypothetical protein
MASYTEVKYFKLGNKLPHDGESKLLVSVLLDFGYPASAVRKIQYMAMCNVKKAM